jgi:hypothetical protein
MRRIVPLLVGVAALASVVATPAEAVAPTKFVFTVENFTWTDDLCGFPITHVENGTGKFAIFFDQDGNPVKAIGTDMGRFTNTASANGKTLVSNQPFVTILDFVAGTHTEVGLIVAFHVPGEGVVLLAAGRLVVRLTEGPPTPEDVIAVNGPHEPIEGDVEAYCDYFAT